MKKGRERGRDKERPNTKGEKKMATFILTSLIYLIEQYRLNTVYYPDVG